MYSKHDIPLYKACLYYYDFDYRKETAEKVLSVLQRHNFFAAQRIYADKLTDDEFISANGRTAEIFTNAYCEKDVFQVIMTSDDGKKLDEFWKVDWGFTFHKKSNHNTRSTFKPWNRLSILSTHDRLNSPELYEDYIRCIIELIDLICPFYASIEDIGNWVRLMHNKHTFIPGQVQEIFWGNYFGKDYCDKIGLNRILKIPAENILQIGNGVLFTLTDHIRDYNSRISISKRKRIKQCLIGSIKKSGGQGDGLREP